MGLPCGRALLRVVGEALGNMKSTNAWVRCMQRVRIYYGGTEYGGLWRPIYGGTEAHNDQPVKLFKFA